VSPPAPVTAARAPRDPTRRPRREAVRAGALVLLPLAAVGWLLAAPGEPAAVRLAGVGLAWWAAASAWSLALLALALRPRARRGPRGGR
jgi:hypothetical protein